MLPAGGAGLQVDDREDRGSRIEGQDLKSYLHLIACCHIRVDTVSRRQSWRRNINFLDIINTIQQTWPDAVQNTCPSSCGMDGCCCCSFSSSALRKWAQAPCSRPLHNKYMGTCRQSRTGRRQGETPDTETQHHTCNAHLQRSPGLLYLDISSDGAAGSVEGGEPTVSPSAITALRDISHMSHVVGPVPEFPHAPSHVVVLHGDYCCTVHVYTTDCLSRMLREAMRDLLYLCSFLLVMYYCPGVLHLEQQHQLLTNA